MTGYNKKLQDMVAVYCRENDTREYCIKEVANWALRNNLWKAPIKNQADILAHDLGQALRQDYFTDPQGRRVRSKHPVRELQKNAEGEMIQTVFWADIRNAPREHMQASFQQRRHGIINDCRQLKNDVDCYNNNYNPGDMIQMVFNFTEDLEESELS